MTTASLSRPAARSGSGGKSATAGTAEVGSRMVTLHGVPWHLYVALRDLESNNGIRMTYDRGTLTLMSPSPFHERITDVLGWLVLAWAEEHRIIMVPCGSATFRREDLEKGLEPDRCYYIQSEAAVRALKEFPSPPPAPDLALEVDVTSLSDSKFEIYAGLGVREIWLWREDALVCYQWNGQSYVPSRESIALPGFPLEFAAQLLNDQFTEGGTPVVWRFRAVIRQLPPEQQPE